MRHRLANHHFNRDTLHRQALIRNLVRSLLEHGEVVTTQAKAREIGRWTDKIIAKAKKAKTNDLATRRSLHRFFGKRDVVNTLVERIVPGFAERKSGFTTAKMVGIRRGDNTELVRVSLLVKPEKPGLKNPQPGSNLTRKTKPAKKTTTKPGVKPAAKPRQKTTQSVKKTKNQS